MWKWIVDAEEWVGEAVFDGASCRRFGSGGAESEAGFAARDRGSVSAMSIRSASL